MMEDQNSKPVNPLLMIFYVLITVAGGFIIIGPLIGFFLALPFYDGGMLELVKALEAPGKNSQLKIPLYIIQGTATFVGLIAAPALLLRVFQRRVTNLFVFDKNDWVPLTMIPLLVMAFMGLNSIFVEWNANLNLPESLKGLEEWARQKEDAAGELTVFMTTFNSFGELLIAMVVIAILPAIGEELVFRGLIQKLFIKAHVNPHVSIWVAAFLFSAIHMQFFGFVPRMLLGALFGYLYFWSGNLYMPVMAHFVNNGFAVIGIYLVKKGTLEYNIEGTEALPWNYIILTTGITFALLYYFKRYYHKGDTENAAEV